MKYKILLFILLIPLFIVAQSKTISLQEAIDIALRQHPAIKTADLEIQQKQVLQGTGFELKKTNIYYEGTALGRNSTNLQNDFGAQQIFELPKVYKAKDAVFDAHYEAAKTRKTITELALKQQVTQTYMDWLLSIECLEKIQQQDSLYLNFLTIAKIRNEVGEANINEYNFIKQRQSLFQIKLTALKSDVAYNTQILKNLLQVENLGIPNENFELLQIEGMKWAEGIKAHPNLAYWQQQEKVGIAKTKAEETQLTPDFSIGYAAQFFSDGLFNGVHLGIQIPLHKAPQHQRIEAAKIQTDIAKNQFEQEKFQLNNRLNELLILKNKYEQLFAQLEISKTQTKKMLDVVKYNYNNGESTYLEYLNLIEMMIEVDITWFDYAKNYNQTMIEISFLLL